MFDFHLHTNLSFDCKTAPEKIIEAAEKKGLSEICLTDHFDHNSDVKREHHVFSVEDYKRCILPATSKKIKVRHGVEFGLTEWNQQTLIELESNLPLDFVIGSVHYIDGYDPYEAPYWYGRTLSDNFSRYLEGVYNCVKVHDRFDVLGHINYVCKAPHNVTREPLRYKDYSDIVDEIMKILVSRGKGMEINSSGCDRVGEFLPSKEFLVRFRELGGEIVTIGSDAHDPSRVGQYTNEASEILKDVFGYACTFEGRKPIFHKL
jgi:histidinol-phosphatase (PHP family)